MYFIKTPRDTDNSAQLFSNVSSNLCPEHHDDKNFKFVRFYLSLNTSASFSF